MNPETSTGLEAGSGGGPQRPKGEVQEDGWALARERLVLLGGFVRRRGLLILSSAAAFAGLASLISFLAYPVTYTSGAVVAVDDRDAAALAGIRALPETGYRMLAESPEVLDRLRSHPASAADLDAGRRKVRLLDPREVRQQGLARLLQLSVTAKDPRAAADLANAWAAALVEVESRRAREAGRETLERALEERWARQQRRVREHEVRFRVASEASTGAGEEASLALQTERALLELAAGELEQLRRHRSPGGDGGSRPDQEGGLAADLAAAALPDARLEEILDRLETARGRLSVLLPALPGEGNRAGSLLVRAILAGLAGGLLGLLLAGSLELSAASRT